MSVEGSHRACKPQGDGPSTKDTDTSLKSGQLAGNLITSTGSFTPVVLAVFITPRLRFGLIFAYSGFTNR
jgi:hypothetical protein